MQLWSLIDAQQELKLVVDEQQQAAIDGMADVDQLLAKSESAMWQIMAIQLDLQWKFQKMEQMSYTKDSSAASNEVSKFTMLDKQIENVVDVDPLLDSTDPRKKRYVCPTCGRVFNQSTNLLKHQRVHTGEKPYVCSGCGLTFRQKTNLNRHVRVYHPSISTGATDDSGAKRSFACSECGERFARYKSYLQHMTNHKKSCVVSKRSRIDVESDDDTTMVEDDAQRPQEFAGHRKRFECKMCDFGCNRRVDFMQHQKDCGEGFIPVRNHKIASATVTAVDFGSTSDVVKTEIESDDDTTMVDDDVQSPEEEACNTCATCGKTFPSPYALRRHQVVHTKERPFICPHCGRDYPQGHQMILHIRKFHPNMEERYECMKCHEKFHRQNAFTRHMDIHADDDSLRCTRCPVTFQDADALKLHMENVHNRVGEQPIEDPDHWCQICEKFFASKQQHMRHQRLHLNERAFICPYCGQDFAHDGYMKSHFRKHHPGLDRCYVCLRCHAKFDKPSDFTTHVETHANEEPLRCIKCTETFTSVKLFCGHMMNVHP